MKPFTKLVARSEETFINGKEATSSMNDLVSSEAVKKNLFNVYDLWFFKPMYLFTVFLKNIKNRKIFGLLINILQKILDFPENSFCN